MSAGGFISQSYKTIEIGVDPVKFPPAYHKLFSVLFKTILVWLSSSSHKLLRCAGKRLASGCSLTLVKVVLISGAWCSVVAKDVR